MAAAVSEAGGLGFLAGGYLSAQRLGEQISELRALTERPFGANLFMATPKPADPRVISAYLSEISGEAERQQTELGEPRFGDDDFAAKLELVLAERVPVISFTFGCPSEQTIARLREAGLSAWVTATNLSEARLAQCAGADALILQGIEAGGHRSSWSDGDEPGHGLIALLRLVSNEISLPLIAAGGVADGAALAAVLCAGASAAQIGTALMLSPEAGTVPSQRAVFSLHRPTRLTRAFSGRLARGILNRFMTEHDAAAPSAYPEINNATSPLRARARERDDHEAFNLWAGEAYELATERPAAEILSTMGTEARRVLRARADAHAR
jgi:nitronate monooxygenase